MTTVCNALMWFIYPYSPVLFHLNRVNPMNAPVPVTSLIARFMGPTWDPSGADRTQVGPMLTPWTLLSGVVLVVLKFNSLWPSHAIWRGVNFGSGNGLLPGGNNPLHEPMLTNHQWCFVTYTRCQFRGYRRISQGLNMISVQNYTHQQVTSMHILPGIYYSCIINLSIAMVCL